jgi:homoserine dehydrogenase
MGVLGDITHLLAKNGVSIEAVIQKSAVAEEDIAQIVVLTNLVQEHLTNIAIRAIEALPTVVDRVVRLRVENFK